MMVKIKYTAEFKLPDDVELDLEQDFVKQMFTTSLEEELENQDILPKRIKTKCVVVHADAEDKE